MSVVFVWKYGDAAHRRCKQKAKFSKCCWPIFNGFMRLNPPHIVYLLIAATQTACINHTYHIQLAQARLVENLVFAMGRGMQQQRATNPRGWLSANYTPTTPHHSILRCIQELPNFPINFASIDLFSDLNTNLLNIHNTLRKICLITLKSTSTFFPHENHQTLQMNYFL